MWFISKSLKLPLAYCYMSVRDRTEDAFLYHSSRLKKLFAINTMLVSIGFNSSVIEDSILVRYDSVSLANWFLMF
jgi:hypothetical protein